MPTQDIPAVPDATTSRSQAVEVKLKEARLEIREVKQELRQSTNNASQATAGNPRRKVAHR